MAIPRCTFCEDENGVLMVTMLNDGDTAIVGPACLAGYALGLADTATQGLPPEAAGVFDGLFDALRANDPRPAVGAAGRPGRVKAASAAAGSAGGPVSDAEGVSGPLSDADLGLDEPVPDDDGTGTSQPSSGDQNGSAQA
jgi:hypothetical protein